MKKYPKFPIAVLSLTLLLVLASLVLTFVGAFRGENGDPLFKTGITGLILVPMIGWLMVVVYNRVHKDDRSWSEKVDRMYREQQNGSGETEDAAGEADADAEDGKDPAEAAGDDASTV